MDAEAEDNVMVTEPADGEGEGEGEAATGALASPRRPHPAGSIGDGPHDIMVTQASADLERPDPAPEGHADDDVMMPSADADAGRPGDGGLVALAGFVEEGGSNQSWGDLVIPVPAAITMAGQLCGSHEAQPKQSQPGAGPGPAEERDAASCPAGDGNVAGKLTTDEAGASDGQGSANGNDPEAGDGEGEDQSPDHALSSNGPHADAAEGGEGAAPSDGGVCNGRGTMTSCPSVPQPCVLLALAAAGSARRGCCSGSE
jgi:hypothetical protein